MRDVTIRRAAPIGRLADRDKETYFRLSLFSAEKARIRQRLDDLQAQQEVLRKRLDLVDGQMQKLQSGLGGSDGGLVETYRSCWQEVELEY